MLQGGGWLSRVSGLADAALPEQERVPCQEATEFHFPRVQTFGKTWQNKPTNSICIKKRRQERIWYVYKCLSYIIYTIYWTVSWSQKNRPLVPPTIRIRWRQLYRPTLTTKRIKQPCACCVLAKSIRSVAPILFRHYDLPAKTRDSVEHLFSSSFQSISIWFQ